MAVIGVGIDIVPSHRVERLLARHGDRALARLFTPGERERAASYMQPALHLASRIAAKEAAFKALSGEEAARGIGWQDLEVTRAGDGRPTMVFHGPALRRFEELGASRCNLSLTHSSGVAAAVVILE